LDQQSIDAGAGEGKVGFGSIYNENKADPAKACQIAILAFQDGLFAVFANDVEFTKTDQQVPLEKDTIITFIRLTFLAGGFW
ncbi:MAG TPA: hypothetical protein VN824_18030, partial [Puia sp.]|nr:hypothetical protein [Puia sp.]